MKKAIVIGSGAGGAAAARELQGKYQVTILEAGSPFKPLGIPLPFLERMRSTGLFLSEKMIGAIYPAYRIAKTGEGMVLVHGKGLGGTTTLACGNALRMDAGLRALGINLDEEFSTLEQEIPITTDHRHLWREPTRRLFSVCDRAGLHPFPVPKSGNYKDCRNCGHCTLGCPHGIKWDASVFVRQAAAKGAEIITRCTVRKLIIKGNRCMGVLTNNGIMNADLVIVAAGGFNTPVILKNSGIPVDDLLFVDPVLCVAAEYPDAFQNHELPMPFAVQQKGYILSPYFDQLSFFFNKNWRKPGQNIFSLMIKLADSEHGNPRNKTLTAGDRETLNGAVAQCKDLLVEIGIKPKNTFLGTLNAGHPGGTLPLTAPEAESFHNPRLPENVYVADASLFPRSLGNPPILTIMAMAKRISRLIVHHQV